MCKQNCKHEASGESHVVRATGAEDPVADGHADAANQAEIRAGDRAAASYLVGICCLTAPCCEDRQFLKPRANRRTANIAATIAIPSHMS